MVLLAAASILVGANASKYTAGSPIVGHFGCVGSSSLVLGDSRPILSSRVEASGLRRSHFCGD